MTKPEKERKKKKKPPVVDDGTVFANMDVEGLPWHGRVQEKENKRRQTSHDKPTMRERFAAILGAYRAYLPAFLLSAAILCLLFLLAKFWFR